MAKFVSFTGYSEFAAKMKNLPKQIEKEVTEEVRQAAKNWEARAIRMAPVDQGRLKGEIRGFLIGPMNAEVVVNVEYAPFIEWGTKTQVRVPADIASYAMQFKGSGKSGNRFALQKLLYAWMTRVGIPEDKQWLVYIHIIVKGIKPHPFFFIQKRPVQSEFIKNIKNILNTEH